MRLFFIFSGWNLSLITSTRALLNDDDDHYMHKCRSIFNYFFSLFFVFSWRAINDGSDWKNLLDVLWIFNGIKNGSFVFKTRYFFSVAYARSLFQVIELPSNCRDIFNIFLWMNFFVSCRISFELGKCSLKVIFRMIVIGGRGGFKYIRMS